eukprot:361767-Pleurochrysis_carterae.AAC.3
MVKRSVVTPEHGFCDLTLRLTYVTCPCDTQHIALWRSLLSVSVKALQANERTRLQRVAPNEKLSCLRTPGAGQHGATAQLAVRTGATPRSVQPFDHELHAFNKSRYT